MNYYDAHEIVRRHHAGLPINYGTYDEAKAFLAAPEVGPPAKPLPKPVFIPQAALNYDTLCVCGMRYGQHRVNDYACQNPRWKPGNGESQWMPSQAFARA